MLKLEKHRCEVKSSKIANLYIMSSTIDKNKGLGLIRTPLHAILIVQFLFYTLFKNYK